MTTTKAQSKFIANFDVEDCDSYMGKNPIYDVYSLTGERISDGTLKANDMMWSDEYPMM